MSLSVSQYCIDCHNSEDKTAGLALDPFPRDGEYDIQVRLTRDRNEEIEGLKEPHELELLVDRERAASFRFRLPDLGFVYMPMGCDITRWTPPSDNSLDELSPALSPLAPVKEYVTAISNLELKNAEGLIFKVPPVDKCTYADMLSIVLSFSCGRAGRMHDADAIDAGSVPEVDAGPY